MLTMVINHSNNLFWKPEKSRNSVFTIVLRTSMMQLLLPKSIFTTIKGVLA